MARSLNTRRTLTLDGGLQDKRLPFSTHAGQGPNMINVCHCSFWIAPLLTP